MQPPFRFVTYKFPALSSATPVGLLSPVLTPPMVRAGATLPFAPGGNTKMLLVLKSATKRLSALSSATTVGLLILVLVPPMVRAGNQLPLAPGGNTRMLGLPAARSEERRVGKECRAGWARVERRR